MLRKIDDGSVMTFSELREYYPDSWFCYLIVEDLPFGYPLNKAAVRAIFLADTRDELMNIPMEQRYEPNYPNGGDYWGIRVNPEPGVQIGGVEVAWT